MNRMNIVKLKFIDYKDNKEEIDKYLVLKGLERYKLAQNYAIDHNIELTWSNVSKIYKTDKNICYLLYRYLSFYEEYLKAKITNNYEIKSINESNVKDEIIKWFPKINKKTIDRIVEIQRKTKANSLFEIVENAPLETLIFIIRFSNITINTDELFQITVLRNAVAHNHFLLTHKFLVKKESLNLEQMVKIFLKILPKNYAYNKDKSIGLQNEFNELIGRIRVLK